MGNVTDVRLMPGPNGLATRETRTVVRAMTQKSGVGKVCVG